MELILGSNNLRNTNGVIKIQGKAQVVLEHTPTQIFLTMDFYDAGGAHVAHLRRNRWAFNSREQFILQTSAPTVSTLGDRAWLRIIERQSKTVLVDITTDATGRVTLVNGRFCSHTGDMVEVTPHVCRVGTVSLFGEVRECRGGSVIIG